MKRFFLSALVFVAGLNFAQAQISDSINVDDLLLIAPKLKEVNILGTWAKQSDPIAQVNLNRKDIQSLNTGRDLPYVLQDVAGVVSFSDAGNGIGYTNMRIRGSDITRINVTVNGIPMNDAESHGVFWVNTPDLMSSTNAIQLQKGLGTSTNGSGAFGATLGLNTLGANEQGGRVIMGLGSYGTQRATVEANTGQTKNGFWLNSRLSTISSNGYVDRASSDLQSYYLSGGFASGDHSVEIVRFGGGERTYQAWWGIDSTTMYGGAYDAAPTTNYAGAIYDDNWNVLGAYDDQVDDYGQEHTQLHYRFNNLLGGTLSAALHHTAGAGYFEEYNQGYGFADFGISPYYNSAGDTVIFGDVATRKWLDNDFYGATASWMTSVKANTLIIGGGAHRYEGAHFGQVIWANNPNVDALSPNYYSGDAVKDDANIYAKWSKTQNKMMFYGDLQYRFVQHSSAGGSATGPANFDRTFNFINPKAGLTYSLKGKQVLGAYLGLGHKEPNRTDLQNTEFPGDIKAEQMLDLEMNYRNSSENWDLDVNIYRQQYQNQLVLTGFLDAQGYPIRANTGLSFRQGLEVAGRYNFTKELQFSANMALSQNQNVDWIGDPLSSTIKNTTIAFSPAVVGGGRFSYAKKGFETSIWNQFIGKQYLSNGGLEAQTLPAYHLVNARVSYTWSCNANQRIIGFVEVRNLGDLSYAANGYMWDITPYYYAQATRNVMTGVTFEF
jgi:iron complex outermembrane recepter protein